MFQSVSEHYFFMILKIFNDIENNQTNQNNQDNNYNLKLFNNITKIYNRQIDKLIHLYNKHNIKLNDIVIDNNDNINHYYCNNCNNGININNDVN